MKISVDMWLLGVYRFLIAVLLLFIGSTQLETMDYLKKEFYVAQVNVDSEMELWATQLLEKIEEKETSCPAVDNETPFSMHTAEYADYIVTIGPLLREYPEMIYFLINNGLVTNDGTIIVPTDFAGDLISP
jgi:hypothetical protein